MNTSKTGPELFLGLVATVGTDLQRVIEFLAEALRAVNYVPEPTTHLATLLRSVPGFTTLPGNPLDVYINKHMTAGNEFRHKTGRNDAMALLGVGEILQERKEQGLEEGQIQERRAYIIRSLKHPDEVETLREIYGDAFYLIAAHSPRAQRRDFLARGIANSKNEFPPEKHFPEAEGLIRRDEQEDEPYGQNVRDTFHRADVFLDTSDPERLKVSIHRFIELIFGNTFHTPTQKEFAMFHAKAAALRSAELGRQVGAAIANSQGDIIAVGTNEVPKAHGGLYWCGDKPDRREYVQDYDSNDEHIRNLVADTLARLQKGGWLNNEFSQAAISDLVPKILDGDTPVLSKKAELRNLIEFGRAVHAEMAALTSAAQRGVSVAGSAMFVTTFPCHLCSRHIVAAGIGCVHYIEPYAKSLTTALYPDSIALESAHEAQSQILFVPFVGVSPRQYMRLFEMTVRKAADGRVKQFVPSEAGLRYFPKSSLYLDKEKAYAAVLRKSMNQQGILF